MFAGSIAEGLAPPRSDSSSRGFAGASPLPRGRARQRIPLRVGLRQGPHPRGQDKSNGSALPPARLRS
jgi:hypothetical protein